MSYTSEQLLNFIKVDTRPKLQIAFKMEDGYIIPTQNECISYLLEQIKELELSRTTQQQQINDLKQKYEYLEKLILSK